MIIITGAAGFIASCLLTQLDKKGYKQLVAIDDFNREEKFPNFTERSDLLKIDRNTCFPFLEKNAESISAVFHLGARTDTVDQRVEVFQELNLDFSKKIWGFCVTNDIPLIYASSAATYGNGELGFDDKMQNPENLEPLNEYGRSKHHFDLWINKQKIQPSYWIGLKFFNVYGPNEYHKERMASVIFHAYHQIQKTGKMKLFRSHKEQYGDGEQSRDFIFVKDVIRVMVDLFENPIQSGIYNLGTGKARSFNDLVKATFAALDLETNIEYIDTPLDIRENYQYFTEAKMQKLIDQGINCQFHSLEDGVSDYVKNYLIPGKYY